MTKTQKEPVVQEISKRLEVSSTDITNRLDSAQPTSVALGPSMIGDNNRMAAAQKELSIAATLRRRTGVQLPRDWSRPGENILVASQKAAFNFPGLAANVRFHFARLSPMGTEYSLIPASSPPISRLGYPQLYGGRPPL